MTDFLTTREVAALLRVKERKIYDLVSKRAIPFSKATGKLLFERGRIDAWMAARSPSALHDTYSGRDPAAGPAIITGSHDPLLEAALRLSGCGIAVNWNGSTDGLSLLAAGGASASALHIFDPVDASWNVNSVRAAFEGQPFVLIEWARRQRGLVLKPALAETVGCLADIKPHRIVGRQAGAGAHILLQHLLANAGIDQTRLSFPVERHNELEAVLAILEDKADIAFGLQNLSQQYQLGFLPLVEERVDLLVSRRFYFEPSFQILMQFCRSPGFAALTAELAGYDSSNTGSVRFNSPA